MVDYHPTCGHNLRMLHRHLIGPLQDALSDTPAVLLNGARQTGKSAVVLSAEFGEKSRQDVAFDDPGVLAAGKRDASGLVAGLQPPNALDEVQLVLGLFPVIKATIERKR